MNVPIELLRCPISGQTMRPAPASIVERLLDEQRRGILRTRDGECAETFDDGLVTIDDAWFYPIRKGIPVLLAGEAIAVERHA